MAKQPQKFPVVFYATPAGGKVVRDWLKSLDEADRAGFDAGAVPLACRHAAL
jgi:hypothetical protein